MKSGTLFIFCFLSIRKCPKIDRIDTFYIYYMIISIIYCTKQLPSEGTEYLPKQTRNGNTTNTLHYDSYR